VDTNAIATIEKVLRTRSKGPLMESMVDVPQRGATDLEIAQENKLLPRPLSNRHRDLLGKWNGVNLDMVRVYGLGRTDENILRLAENQLDLSQDFPGWIVFASNPSGFVYAEDVAGIIYSYDTQALAAAPEAAKVVASDLDDFFFRYVFGPDSDTFCAGDWKELLQKAGVFF